jgi:hypothetical protein
MAKVDLPGADVVGSQFTAALSRSAIGDAVGL